MRSLEILSGDMVSLRFSTSAVLEVRLSGEGGAAVPGEPISFTLAASNPNEMAGGSTLSAASVITDGDGKAAARVDSGAAAASFRVVAEAAFARPVVFYATVSSGSAALDAPVPDGG